MYKKLNKKQIKVIYGIILLITLNFAFIPSFNTPRKKNNSDVLELKTSGVFYDIEIDDLPGSLTNWSWAETQPWFGGGSGTSGDPYIIEDHTFEFSTGSGNCFNILNSRKYFIINNCTFKNSGGSGNGLYFSNTTNGQILSNLIYDNYRGIRLSFVNDTIVSDNNVTNNDFYGIFLSNSYSNDFLQNNVSNNGNRAFRLESSLLNNIVENLIEDNINDDGILLTSNSHNNTISGNIITNNGEISPEYGIDIAGASSNNTITGNIITDHIFGGIHLYAGCSGNFLYENILKNNTVHAVDDGSNNDWNNTLIGNYWDDYDGYDMDLNGIGDTPYTFIGGSAGSIDYLPIWNIQTPIEIDDLPSSPNNWAWAVTQAWCTGSGTSGDPYIIENLKIRGNSTHSGINIQNSNADFVIDHCELNNSVNDSGIYLSNVTNGKITNNYLYNNSFGVLLDGDCDFNIISQNIAYKNSWQGIRMDTSDNNTITGNTLNNNGGTTRYHGLGVYDSNGNSISNNIANENNAHGIRIYSSEFNSLTENSLENNGERGISIDSSSHHNTLLQNTANSNDNYGIYIADSDFNMISENTASDNVLSNFYLLDSNNNTLYKNVADKVSTYGIYLVGSDFNEIIECEVYNITDRGIYLFNSHNNTISKNIAMYNFWGLFAEFSNDNTFSKNTFNNNTELGMAVENTYGNKILENTANFNMNTWGGIMVSISVDTLVQDNTIIGNNPRGIGIIYDSDNNNATGNIIRENTIGMKIESGSDNNLVYENFFLKNGLHAVDDGSNNDWNSTTIGNYWDNHTGPDTTPNDGIVDNPYPYIGGSTGNVDYLPIAEDGPPSITINSPSENDVFGTSAPSFSVTITDTFLDEMWYTIDGGLNNYSFTGSTGTIDQSAWDAMPDGMITLTFYASDIPGNIGSAEVNIEKDANGPLIDITSPHTDDTFGASAPSFIVEISDDHIDSMWYSLDGGLNNFLFTANGTVDQAAWAALLEGSVTITFYANDTLGNLSSESVDVVKSIPPPDDNFVVIIIIIVSIVAGVAIVTVVLLLRRRKAGVEV